MDSVCGVAAKRIFRLSSFAIQQCYCDKKNYLPSFAGISENDEIEALIFPVHHVLYYREGCRHTASSREDAANCSTKRQAFPSLSIMLGFR